MNFQITVFYINQWKREPYGEPKETRREAEAMLKKAKKDGHVLFPKINIIESDAQE